VSVATVHDGFGTLLRGWRRLRHLSQESLAHEADISQRHLSCLESGRASPSREMVVHLCHALDVPLRERNVLLTAAGFAPAYAHRPLDGPELEAVSRAVDLMLDGLSPCPALAVDRDWNLVRANGAALATFAAFVDLDAAFARADPTGRANVLRLLFHPEGLRAAVADWDVTGPLLLDRIRREVAADPSWALGRSLLGELVDLAGFDPSVRPLAAAPDPVLTMALERDGLRVDLFSMIATFGTAQDVTVQELRIETFFPADDRSRVALDGLVGGLADRSSAPAPEAG
jgi:transcriptional regulator with XRE-family HTH domain